MKIDINAILNALIKKLQFSADSLSKFLIKTRNVLLLLVVVIASLYLIKYETTRIYGIAIFVLSFAWLYSYVVQRRGTRKK
jgi:Ca2+/Na+ antiporter